METNALAPMTELEAINEMLAAIGESPVASISEAQGVPDALIALNMLRNVSRLVQTKGWHWNTEQKYRLAPNEAGEIILPSNTAKVDPSDPQVDYVRRGGKLWDRANKTFVIGKPVLVDIVLLHPFDDLPQTARCFIAQAALRRFENRLSGDSGANQINVSDALAAWADLLQEECDNAEYNVSRDSPTARRITVGRFGWRSA